MSRQVFGFVLAGGRSSRFGADKALHPIDGVPMVLRVVAALRGAGLEVRVVARDRRLEELGVQVLVEDPDAPRHPLAGVVAALAQLEEGQEALFAPCDLPGLATEHLRLLLAGPAPVAAVCEGEVHPLLCRLPASHLGAARLALASHAASRRLTDGARLVELPAAAVHNLNRPPG